MFFRVKCSRLHIFGCELPGDVRSSRNISFRLEYLRIVSEGRLRFHGGLPGPPPLLLEGLPETPHAGGLLVLVQVGLEGEGLVAAPADKWLGVGVGLDVGPQVGLVGKGFVADGTGERFLSCKN